MRPMISFPFCECSTLELISPEGWITIDGYEFAQNEFVTCLDCVTLESMSSESGGRDFIAVGTTVNRGEDLVVKGAVYIFQVVPDAGTGPKRLYCLKLKCRQGISYCAMWDEQLSGLIHGSKDLCASV
ncbi:hypothetical protein WOLCODRAFT_119666 [Wolfiporia cocos MD-104 SS10]|uniref:RSE1/DDB1/CPSF1 C-terminal domain-containing protein n=1 Tax=Wolfiporia cocos (strain MD-104) TaxID=742152 RepID=A0A2H3JI74_WOLCO|nr:hypothetical protein WOLCODRAFT_119666 [Wolfiporia cocos MD-104 SS10]